MELPSASLAEPLLLLRVGAADQDGVGAQMDGEEAGGDAEADLAHLLGDRGDVAGAAAQAAVLLGDEEQLQADLGSEQLADDVLGEDLVCVALRGSSRGSASAARICESRSRIICRSSIGSPASATCHLHCVSRVA